MKMLTLCKSFLLTSVFSVGAFAQVSTKSTNWAIRYTEWSQVHEKTYQEFIFNLGMAREKGLCKTTAQCLTHPQGNPLYYKKNPESMKNVFSDCADLPYVLRAYFAWMNDLPFSYPSAPTMADPSADRGKDIRYTSKGNKIAKIYQVKNGDNVRTVLTNLVNSISSAMFRIHPEYNPSGKVFSDLYPIALNRKSLVPGTVLYDPAGHVGVVYRIGDDGRIYIIDAHPDNSLTRITYGEKFLRSRPSHGAGFKGWRPITLVGAKKNAMGLYEGGYLEAAQNQDIESFGLEQYYGTNPSAEKEVKWSKGLFILNDTSLSYYDYLRRVMAKGELKYNPVLEMKALLDALCIDLKDRVDAVNEAIDGNIHRKDQPLTLPDNIYGTHGEWETYSTPSRDARFKSSTREVRKLIEEYVNAYKANSPAIDYQGDDLVSDLKQTYEETTLACQISYKNSKGSEVVLNLDQIFDRVFDLSFDPYQCIELRWGASGNELASCPDSENKKRWYKAEAKLRNIIDRDYDLNTNLSLEQLTNAKIGNANPEDISLKKYLKTL